MGVSLAPSVRPKLELKSFTKRVEDKPGPGFVPLRKLNAAPHTPPNVGLPERMTIAAAASLYCDNSQESQAFKMIDSQDTVELSFFHQSVTKRTTPSCTEFQNLPRAGNAGRTV
jgi:hypothetical protein